MNPGTQSLPSRTGLTARVAGVLLCIVLISPGRCVGSAQNASARVDLGSTAGGPGSRVFIPIVLAAPENMEIGSVTEEVPFPTDLLNFKGARIGLSAELAGAEVKADVKAIGGETGSSAATVTIRATRSLGNGVLATLEFAIPERIEKEKKIALKNQATVLALHCLQKGNDPDKATGCQPVETEPGSDGEIDVTTATPAFSCFFYMH